MSMLEVNDLAVYYDDEGDAVQAVDGISFELEEGENLGIVGESGCGKSTLAKSIIGILPDNGYIDAGKISFYDEDLTSVSKHRRRELRWEEIALIAQSAMNALDPVYTVRKQIIEAIEVHRPKVGKHEANEMVDEVFDLVGLDYARGDDYPHQYSGGMRKRAMIAMALVLKPSLILADEPTTALDVIMQDQILKRISDIQSEVNSSMIVITHDVAVVAETCDRVIVMYAGEIVEEGPVEDIFNHPYHPYTLGLKSAFPNIREEEQNLVSIAGTPPNLINPPQGCRFAARCPMATEMCLEQNPPMVQIENQRSKCHYADQIDERLRPHANDEQTWNQAGILGDD